MVQKDERMGKTIRESNKSEDKETDHMVKEPEFSFVDATWEKLRKSFSEMEISEAVADIYIYIYICAYV